MMRRRGFRCGERFHHRANGRMKTIDVRTAVAGRGNVNQLRREAAGFRVLAHV